MIQEQAETAYLPMVQAVAETIAPEPLHIEIGVPKQDVDNLAFKVTSRGLRLRDFVVFNQDIPISKNDVTKFFIAQFREYLVSVALI
jgi:hypothetical protein